MSAGSKRRAIEICFYERICHMFPRSKFRRAWDLGLCTLGYLRKENRYALPDSDFFCGRKMIFSASRHYAAVLRIRIKCNSMNCPVNWIPLRICVRSTNAQPHLDLQAKKLEILTLDKMWKWDHKRNSVLSPSLTGQYNWSQNCKNGDDYATVPKRNMERNGKFEKWVNL